MEKYIKDDGKIRNCASNIAKMNMFYYMIWDFPIFCKTLWEQLKQTCIDFLHGIVILLFCGLFPITMIVRSVVNIKRARKEVRQEQERIVNEKEEK